MIPIAKPLFGEEEQQAAARVIASGWVTQGPEVAAFEKEFAEYCGAKYAVAVSSCTTALHLALRAVGVGPGDEVITVSHSFIATANSIRYCRATPVFIDIDPGTFNMRPDLVEPAIRRRTKAVLCVHQMGMPCDLAAILDVARRRGVPVVEDAACAIGSEIQWDGRWERIGRPRGAVACFSFHPRKVITTGDGGMLTTDNAEHDSKFRLWRQHAMSVPDTARHKADQVIFESYTELGFNYRMTDIQAAVGRVQLGRLPGILERRRQLAKRYLELLADIPGLGLPVEPPWARSNWQSFCVRLPRGCDQRMVMQRMLDAGIATRRGVMCAHREPAFNRGPWLFSDRAGPQQGSASSCVALREGERAQDHCVLLPLFPQMRDDEQNMVTATLHAAIGT
ncbi:MAG: DegT/DnrJ/EryC1/StrS family aminotransferase [Planctomycetes bacterium]|nr:DegT/DnrJ/EryC1/StrS family aminotransferase [Planctomycetota bacterium]